MYIITINGVNGSEYATNFANFILKYYFKDANISSFNYSTRKSTLREILEAFENYLNDLTKDRKEDIILIGHSFGGIVARSSKNTNIKHVITISTPHRGAHMAHIINKFPKLAKFYLGEIYDDILSLKYEKPNHNITTISSSILPKLGFDGTVFTEEMICDDTQNYHINFSYHGLQWFDLRFIKNIIDIIKSLNVQ